MMTTEVTEMFGRYKITISGPDSLSGNKFWVRFESTTAYMGRTKNNGVALVADLAAANKVVAEFKAQKKNIAAFLTAGTTTGKPTERTDR